jgi:glutaminyl-peptide cyclotransferase
VRRSSSRRPRRPTVAALVTVVALGACGGQAGDSARSPASPATEGTRPVCRDAPTEVLVPEVVRELPHDRAAFTQGLVVAGDRLVEGTGLVGESSIREVVPETGEVVASAPLEDAFGEGVAALGDGRFLQLTWTDGFAQRWRRTAQGFEPEGRVRYRGEGWGLAALDDGTLVMSDGTDRLSLRDPEDFTVVEVWDVSRSDGRADQLNELDWDGSRLWANRWRTDEIVGIDPACRHVDRVVDAAALTRRAEVAAVEGGRALRRGEDVLNGVAHLPGTDRYYVTGKRWPVLFEVRFVPGAS